MQGGGKPRPYIFITESTGFEITTSITKCGDAFSPRYLVSSDQK
jgi:hypothetical protein